MKRLVIITEAMALEGEKGYSRFRTLAEMMSKEFEVDLITSSFQHWEKRQRDKNAVAKIKAPYRILIADEPGYTKNVDIKRVISHRVIVKNIMKIIMNNNYDVIYCPIPDNKVASEVGRYARANGIPMIVDVEDLWPEAMEMVSPFPQSINSLLFKPYRKQAKNAYDCADAFIGTSDEYRDVPKVKYGITGKPSYTVYVGCDMDDYDVGVQEFASEIKKESKDFWVTYAGNLGSSYDIPTMIMAAQSIYEKYPDIKFKILGSGPLEGDFKNLASKQECNVEFLGYTPYRKMAAFLTKSDILINSFVKKAPQSIVTKIGDYLAAGKPMINTLSSPEFRKKVEDDGFGINVDAEDTESLADAIIQMYKDTDNRLIMGRKARKIAEEQFDRKNSYKVIVELAKSLCEE